MKKADQSPSLLKSTKQYCYIKTYSNIQMWSEGQTHKE